MAHMIPDDPPGFGPGMRAETTLYEALQSQLPDDFFVYHGLRYLEAERAAEGEADFLILHREHGLLSVECKGEGVRRTGTGQWFRIYGDGTEQPLKEDPFHQAQRTVKELVKELNNRLQGMIPRLEGRFPFFHGSLIVFYDPQQEIFGRDCNIPDFGVNFPLNCNSRNTCMIFQAIRKVVDVDMLPRLSSKPDLRNRIA